MPSLSDHIDTLARNTKHITAAAEHATESSTNAGPFTAAILYSHLGDLIRDVDPSELGLFSLVSPHRSSAQEKPKELERINFHGATPLRKPNPRHDDASRTRDVDPELYAEAALKYMDRYKLVRQMPRAQTQVQAILERIPVLKQSIDDLTDRLHQFEHTRSTTETDYKAPLEEEEQRIRNLRARLVELTDKRFALSKAKKSHLDLAENKVVTRKPIASSEPRAEEDEFWNTPAVSARTFKFTGDSLLMDEKADFGDIASISFSASPTIPKTSSNIFTSAVLDVPTEKNPRHHLFQMPGTSSGKETNATQTSDSPSTPIQDVYQQNDPDLGKEIETVCPEASVAVTDEAEATETPGIIITHTVELIAGKIWTTMPDLVISAAATKDVDLRDKPSTRDIIHYLEYMQEATPSDDITTVTTNSTPTLPQVLTATLLVGLLASSPEHSLQLTKVKDLLAARTDVTSNPSQPNSSRIVYGCVAKRLLRIDRSGGEQIVQYDV